MNISNTQDIRSLFLKCDLKIRDIFVLILKFTWKYFYYIKLNKISFLSLIFCYVLGKWAESIEDQVK